MCLNSYSGTALGVWLVFFFFLFTSLCLILYLPCLLNHLWLCTSFLLSSSPLDFDETQYLDISSTIGSVVDTWPMSGQLVPITLNLGASIALPGKQMLLLDLSIVRLKVPGVSSKILKKKTQPRGIISWWLLVK